MSEDAGRRTGSANPGGSSTKFEELPDAPPKRPLRLTRIGKAAVSIVAFWLAIAVVGPWLAPYHEADIVADDSFIEAGRFCSEWEPDQCSFHVIGTDYLGRDLLSRIIYGARTTIGISVAATVLAYLIGVTLGIAAAVGGVRLDTGLSRFNDAFISMPNIMLGLVVIAAIGSTIPILIVTAGCIFATVVFRIARSLALDVMVSDFVEAARGPGRGARVDHPQGDPAEHRDAARHRLRPAAGVHHPVHLEPELPRPRRAAAPLGLGVDGEGEPPGSRLRVAGADRPGHRHRDPHHLHQPDRRRRLRPRRRAAREEDALVALLEVDDLRIDAHTDFGEVIPIVKGVSFEVARGDVVALIGESGSGKTTIALSALGYVKPGLEFTGGEVRLDGRDVITMPSDERRLIRGRNVAYLAQSAAATFNPALTIGEQVTETAVQHGLLTQEEANRRAEELYSTLELPDPDRLGRRYPHQVSGGQLQRLMAAMALCGKPDLLVLDEPTTALDVTTQIEVLKAFKKVIKNQGAAAIYVTHDLSVVAQIADYIVVLYAGEIQEMGAADDVISRSTHDYTRRLMAAVRPPPAAGQGEATSEEHLRDAPALETKKVNAGYGRKVGGAPAMKVLFDIDVAIERGQVVGVIGESGCGKSTLARVMAGLTPAFGGDVLLDGTRLGPSVGERVRDELRKVQFVYQMADTALNPRQRIDEILGRPVEFFLGLRGEEKRKRVHDLLEMVELPYEFAGRYPEELSGGQKQRVSLARALAADPEVLLCDEVTSALDSIVGANVIQLLRNLKDRTGVSFVFISHDLSTVSSFADEIVVLYAGRVVEKGPVDEVLSPPFHPTRACSSPRYPSFGSAGWRR